MNRLHLAPLLTQIITCNITLAIVLFTSLADDGTTWLVTR